jgi:hypothetical protein
MAIAWRTHEPQRARRYCGWYPICFTSFANIAISSFITLLTSAGVEPTASSPSVFNRSFTSGSFVIRMSSCES